MWHFLSLLRVHFVWSVNVWKTLKRYFSKRTGVCQQNHGGSHTRAFDLICRSAVMLWHFRHNSGWGQTNHLWYGKLAHFTFYLHSASTYDTCAPAQACRWDNKNTSKKCTHCKIIVLVSLLLLFSSSSFPICMHTSLSNVGVWRPPSPPPMCKMCGLNRFATNYTNFTSL